VKRPALWLVAAFVPGILLGNAFQFRAAWCFAAAFTTLIAGLLLLWRQRLLAAMALGFVSWLALGATAVQVERAAEPADSVAKLASEGRLDLSAPHHWTGRLRSDPLRLPWGERLEIELESVESAGNSQPVHGGLRLNLFGDAANSSALAGIRAGRRVEVLAAAREPRNFLDPGAFDFRGYLARQGTDLVGTLRAPELLQPLETPRLTVASRVARARGDLLKRTDDLFGAQPQVDAVVRAMLLGDRSFVESDLATEFQKTGAYHVLVLAGLHVGIFLAFIYWLARRLGLNVAGRALICIIALAAYVAIVQDRPSILRAALVAAIFLVANVMFRRVDLLQVLSLAALLLLFAQPSLIRDTSFQLTFLAAAIIAGIAVPWLEQTTEPWIRSLGYVQGVTDASKLTPHIAQFAKALGNMADRLAERLPPRLGNVAASAVVAPVRGALRLWEIFIISLALQAGMLPLMAAYFHRVTLTGPLSNIFAVALTGAIVPAGFLTLAVSSLSMHLAAVGVKITSWLTLWLVKSVRFFAHWPRTAYRVPTPPVWLTTAFLLALAALACSLTISAPDRERGKRTAVSVSVIACMILAALIAVAPFAPVRAAGKLEVTTLDVGQGDSIFVMFPNGKTLLVDGGGLGGEEHVGGYRTGMDVGEEVVSPYLWQRRIKHLDAVMLTHAHHDHLDGLHAVLDNFSVGELWVGRDIEIPAYENLLAQGRAKGVTVVHRMRGDSFQWGGVHGQFLWPADTGPADKPTNDDSIVLRLDDGDCGFLLPGDIERPVEKQILADGDSPRAIFLKVPHHGSKTSSTEDFLRAVSPRFAVISVGEDNTFNLPSAQTMDRLDQMGIRYWTTAQSGAVTASSDGREVVMQPFAPAH
jgi:competence protein ComEC